MKRLIILFAILGSFISVKAQFVQGGATGANAAVGRISGSVIDSVTKEPMPYTTISVFRATGRSPLNGVLTDDKGNFKIDGVHPGAYRLEVSFVGYPTKVINNVTTTPSKLDKNLGVIVVAPSARALKTVEVTGAKALIENKIDKIVYNAEKDLTAAGGNATDVLQKVPLVAVDINGNVSVRGDGNVRVLINGKPSGATASNLSDVLKSIPADQIKSVEVITSPSAKYDAEGTAGIINIVTKSSNISGFSGAISGGVGTRQNNGNASFNYNKNRFQLNVNMGGNLTWPQTSITEFTQAFNTSTVNTYQDNKGTTLIKRHAALGNVSATYDFNSYNNISTSFRLTQNGFNTDNSSFDTFTDFNKAANNTTYSSASNSHTTIDAFDWNIDYTHKFKKEGEELDLSTQWSHNSADVNYISTYTSPIFQNMSSINNAKGNEYTFQVDYVDPITKTFKLETGAKTIFRPINSGIQNSIDPGKTGNYVYNDSTSYTYNYSQNVYAGYGLVTYSLPKGYTVLAGVRVENTAISGDPVNTTQPNLSPFTQNYTTFVPSLTLQKALTPSQTLKLTYSKRISRPSLTYLNPFLNQSNALSQSQGNPTLAPEISQTVELNYNAFIGTAIINASTFYKHTTGLIESIANPITYAGRSETLTEYFNVGNNNSVGASMFGSVNPIPIMTIRGQISAYTYNPDPSGLFASSQSQNGTYIQYNAFASASVTTKSGFITELFMIENSPRRTIQGTNPSFSLLGLGVRQQIFNKKASIGINTLEPFTKYKDFNSHISSPGFVQTSTTQFPFRSVGLTFSYNFGKLNFNSNQKKGINNDDLKQGDQGGMGGSSADPNSSQKPPR